MRNMLTACVLATVWATAGLGAQMRPGSASGDTSERDQGGTFTMTGCLEREATPAGAPVIYRIVVTSVSAGETRAASAMGVGGSDANDRRPQDPPDRLEGPYRVVATEKVDLAEYVNHKVELRGSLTDLAAAQMTADRGASQAGSRGGAASSSPSAAGSTASTTAGTSGSAASAIGTTSVTTKPDVFVATSARSLASTCS